MNQKANDERAQGVNDKRAQDAYQFIAEISAANKKLKEDKQLKANKEFRSIARSFPTMVQNNGLNVAVAFLLSKTDGGPHLKIYEKLGNWLEEMDWLKKYRNIKLMKKLVELSRDEYRLTSQEVMAYTSWVKRFAEGRWKKDGEEKE